MKAIPFFPAQTIKEVAEAFRLSDPAKSLLSDPSTWETPVADLSIQRCMRNAFSLHLISRLSDKGDRAMRLTELAKKPQTPSEVLSLYAEWKRAMLARYNMTAAKADAIQPTL